MNVQQNTMWQQPPPQSAAATNPFAAPSGPSVRHYPLLYFFIHSAAICLRVILYFEFFITHIHFSGIFFLPFFIFMVE